MQMANLPIDYHLPRLILSSPSDMDCPKLLNAASKPSAPKCHISPKKQLDLFVEGFCSGDNGGFSSRPTIFRGWHWGPPKKQAHSRKEAGNHQHNHLMMMETPRKHVYNTRIYGYHFPIWLVRNKTVLVKLDHLAVQQMEPENDDFQVCNLLFQCDTKMEDKI